MVNLHRHLDCSCQLDMEKIPYDGSSFTDSLRSDMKSQNKRWLELHYPEMVFNIVNSDKKPGKQYQFIEKICNKTYMVANWKSKR